jgi:UDP-3-O-[3-hydroxymyristoyl] glucosamine N-acyltransferase
MPNPWVFCRFGVILHPQLMLTTTQIAKEIGGSIALNQPEVAIHRAAKLEEGDSHALGFFSNPKYEQSLYQTSCGAVIVPQGFVAQHPISAVLIEHPNPYFAFCTVLTHHFSPNVHRKGIESTHIHPKASLGKDVHVASTAYIEEGAIIGNNCILYPGVYVGRNVSIGDNTLLYTNVVIYADCVVGANCIIQAGSVIGGDGFGFAPVNGKYMKIPQIGNVILEDWVEIGSNCSIDRATMGSTVIKTGTKLDNLVQIAHNVEVGEHTVLAAQTGIAGSTKVGAYSQFGGQVGVAGHLTIAPHTSVGGQGGITGNITEPHQKLTGTPATDVRTYLKSVASTRRIPELIKELEALKAEIAQIKSDDKR